MSRDAILEKIDTQLTKLDTCKQETLKEVRKGFAEVKVMVITMVNRTAGCNG